MSVLTVSRTSPAVHIQNGDHAVEYRMVAGYEAYAVGNDGSLWSRYAKLSYGDEYVLGTSWRRMSLRTKRERKSVCLRRDGVTNYHRLSVLIAEAFIGPRPAGLLCCHKNGNAKDNHVGNLAWGTHKDNSADAIKHGTTGKGERNVCAKLTDESIRDIRRRYIPIRGSGGKGNVYALAREYGVTKYTVYLIVRNKIWRHVS